MTTPTRTDSDETPRPGLLTRLHQAIVFYGSAGVFAFLVVLFQEPPPPDPVYAYVESGSQTCLEDTANNVFVGGAEGQPLCEQTPPASVSVDASMKNSNRLVAVMK